MNKFFSFHKIEYIFFVIIILYLSIVNFKNYNSQKDLKLYNSNKDLKISKVKVKYITKLNSDVNVNVNGTYIPINQYMNEAIIYKHTSDKLWLYRFKEFVSKDENNIYWVLSNKKPIDSNNKLINPSEKNILFKSVVISEMDQYYIYQYIDFGLYIDKGTMFYKNNNKISIDLSKID